MDLTPLQRERVATMSEVIMSNGVEEVNTNGAAGGKIWGKTRNRMY